MGGCLSSKKAVAAEPNQANPAAGQGPTPAAVAANPRNVNFGFERSFDKIYKIEEELGRGQYGITYRCACTAILQSQSPNKALSMW
jgi:hypothetical protein